MNRSAHITAVSSCVAILLLVMHFATPSPSGLWLKTLYNSFHVPVFGIIAICVLHLTPTHWGGRSRLVATMGAVIALSLLSEAAQIPTRRDASFEDLLSNWLGAAGFVCIAMSWSRSFVFPAGRRKYLLALGITFIALPLLPLAKVSAAYVERAQMLPSLIRFDSRFAAMHYYLQDAELSKEKDDSLGFVSANILLNDGPWPGIALQNLWPDWTGYEALIIEIENPDFDKFPVTVRVHDQDHRTNQRYDDRFNQKIELAPGIQTLRIKLADIQSAPAGRQMNMAEISGLLIFATKEHSGRQFTLHQIRLE